MPTKRELALRGLFLCLQDGMADHEVLRNETIPTKVPANGLLIMRDGDAGESDILLSPPRYIYQHRAELEIIVQHADCTQRDQNLDELMQIVGNALNVDSTLSGAVDFMHIGSPELLTEPIEGAATLKATVIPIFLEYTTTNPLS